MENTMENSDQQVRGRVRPWARPVAFGAAGLVAGGLLAGSLTATADDSGSAATEDGGSSTTAPAAPGGDQSQSQHPGEELLTGDTASKVEAAALEEYPDATVVRIETDSDGVYEAHLMTAEGEPVTVEVDKDFTVTGTESHGGPGGVGRPGSGPPAAPDGSGTTGEGGATSNSSAT